MAISRLHIVLRWANVLWLLTTIAGYALVSVDPEVVIWPFVMNILMAGFTAYATLDKNEGAPKYVPILMWVIVIASLIGTAVGISYLVEVQKYKKEEHHGEWNPFDFAADIATFATSGGVILATNIVSTCAVFLAPEDDSVELTTRGAYAAMSIQGEEEDGP